MCSLSQPNKVSVSKETHHYLELYTNNYQFHKSMVSMKGIGMEPIFAVSHYRGTKFRSQPEKSAIKDFDGELKKDDENDAEIKAIKDKVESIEKNKNNLIGIMNETDSDNLEAISHREESARGLLNNINREYNMIDEGQEQESNKSD